MKLHGKLQALHKLYICPQLYYVLTCNTAPDVRKTVSGFETTRLIYFIFSYRYGDGFQVIWARVCSLEGVESHAPCPIFFSVNPTNPRFLSDAKCLYPKTRNTGESKLKKHP